MKSAFLLGALGLTFTNANVINCDKPYGCAGHNINTMNCENNEDCTIYCSSDYACRDLDIYAPTNELSDEKLSLSIDCTSQYSCYGVTIHGNNLDTIKVQCTDWWSCAYMTIEGQTSNQVYVYVPEEGYYSFGSGRVYCPLNTENTDNTDNNNNNNEKIDSNNIACSVECNGERSCYHSKFHNHNGMIDNKLVVGCNGGLACGYAKLYCNYDSDNDEWSKECTMQCNDDDCACDEESDCMVKNENEVINNDE